MSRGADWTVFSFDVDVGFGAGKQKFYSLLLDPVHLMRVVPNMFFSSGKFSYLEHDSCHREGDWSWQVCLDNIKEVVWYFQFWLVYQKSRTFTILWISSLYNFISSNGEIGKCWEILSSESIARCSSSNPASWPELQFNDNDKSLNIRDNQHQLCRFRDGGARHHSQWFSTIPGV